MSRSTAAISAADLVKTYPGSRGAPPVRALDGLSLDVGAGSVFALLGPNGAGKSTTVKILATLARADSGRATEPPLVPGVGCWAPDRLGALRVDSDCRSDIWGSIPRRPLMWSGSDCATVDG